MTVTVAVPAVTGPVSLSGQAAATSDSRQQQAGRGAFCKVLEGRWVTLSLVTGVPEVQVLMCHSGHVLMHQLAAIEVGMFAVVMDCQALCSWLSDSPRGAAAGSITI